jgi:transmembrane sensor
MNRRDKKIDELLQDNRFVDWVLHPDSAYGEYWEQWISQHPDNAALATTARQFVLELQNTQQQIEEETAWDTKSIRNMWSNIATAIQKEHDQAVSSKRIRRWPYWLAAACITGIIILAGMMKWQQRTVIPATVNNNSVSLTIVRYNNSDKEQVYFLPDGSNMVLAKGASVQYNKWLNGNKREVQLTGEVFFNVAKDATKPFYIYTNNIVVKVLGTCFTVTTGATQEKVNVKEGKVAVFKKGQDLEQTAPTILHAREACVYSVPKKELLKSATQQSPPIEQIATRDYCYNFEEAPISKVLGTLEKMYGISVRYDSVALRNCFITTKLGNESLDNKLQVITRTIGASYTLGVHDITISGGRCK